jgi:hypothetical protein
MSGPKAELVSGGELANFVLYVVGLVHGRDRAKETEAKEAVHAKAGEFVQGFAEVNGALRCRDIIDLDVSSEAGLQAYYAGNLQEERCSAVVSNAARLVVRLLAKWEAGVGKPKGMPS